MWNFVQTLLGTSDDPDADGWLGKGIDLVKNIMSIVLGLLTVAVVGVAIYLAVKFFTADDETKRKNAKQQLIYAIVGVVVMIAVTIMAPIITDLVQGAVGGKKTAFLL